MKKLLTYFFVVLFILSPALCRAVSRLDSPGKYFGYIINQKSHEISVQLLGDTKVIDTGGFWKMKLSTGKYYLVVTNPSGKVQKFTMNITLRDINMLRGPWVFNIENSH